MKIDEFDIRIDHEGGRAGVTSTGAPEVLQKVANIAGDIANRFGEKADRAAAKEGREAGIREALGVSLPTVDFVVNAPPESAKFQADQDQTNLMGLIAAPGHNPDIQNIGAATKERFSILQQRIGRQLKINSGFRDPVRNAKAGGAKKSQHMEGNAIDIDVSDMSKAERLQLIAEASVDFPGIGIYKDHIHLDTAGRRAWGETHGRESVPAWAEDAIKQHLAGGLTGSHGQTNQSVPQPEVSATISGTVGALNLKPGGTIRADAYNQAAAAIFRSRLDTNMRLELDVIANENAGNPDGLQEALEAYRAGFFESMPKELQPEFLLSFERQAITLQRQAYRDQAQQTEAELTGEFQTNLAARRTGLFQLAARSGLDPQSDILIASELADTKATIERSNLSPVAKAKHMRDLGNEVVAARVIGAFENEPSPEARQAYAARFQAEWKEGKGYGGNLDPETYNRISSNMASRIISDQSESRREQKRIQSSVENLTKRLKQGYSVPAPEREAIAAQITASGNLALQDSWTFFSGLADWQDANRSATPEQVAAQINAQEAHMAANGASERGIEAIGIMRGLHDEMTAGLKSDPLTWAERAGVAEPVDIDFLTPETLTESLQARAREAEAVAQHYGRQPVFFRASEKAALKAQSETNKHFLPRFAASIRQGLGSQTPDALAEISNDAPLLAHAAGLVFATGQENLLNEIGNAVELRQMQNYKPDLPSPAKRRLAMREHAGGALQLLPKTLNAATEMADALFENRMQRAQLSFEDFDLSDSESREAYKHAVNQSLGARIVDGKQVGGIGEVNGLETLLPVDKSADDLEEMVGRITAGDLEDQDEIVSANGTPIRPGQVRNGFLLAVAPGKYRVALQDPASEFPQYLETNDGYFVLDIEQLERSQAQRKVVSSTRGTTVQIRQLAMERARQRLAENQ